MKQLLTAFALLGMAAPAAAVVTVSYGAVPAYVTGTVVETFDVAPPAPSTSVQSFTSAVGTYTGVNVNDYGFGNGTIYAGAYSNVGIDSTGSYTLSLAAPTTYFGLLITSSDPSNTIQFYDGASLVYSYTVGSNFSGSSFVNFAFSGADDFDSIVFTAASGTGFESDNHTIGAIPEPATWAMMITGFGLVGVARRRRRSAVAA
ncbi:Npun_F0296 family exosortase-dependent surface protein [Glacieibacterium frigidum]|nr:PEPxxWA-CTERM sorting domain-containing protein [Glacieibacterium frigidum]